MEDNGKVCQDGGDGNKTNTSIQKPLKDENNKNQVIQLAIIKRNENDDDVTKEEMAISTLPALKCKGKHEYSPNQEFTQPSIDANVIDGNDGKKTSAHQHTPIYNKGRNVNIAGAADDRAYARKSNDAIGSSYDPTFTNDANDQTLAQKKKAVVDFHNENSKPFTSTSRSNSTLNDQTLDDLLSDVPEEFRSMYSGSLLEFCAAITRYSIANKNKILKSAEERTGRALPGIANLKDSWPTDEIPENSTIVDLKSLLNACESPSPVRVAARAALPSLRSETISSDASRNQMPIHNQQQQTQQQNQLQQQQQQLTQSDNSENGRNVSNNDTGSINNDNHCRRNEQENGSNRTI